MIIVQTLAVALALGMAPEESRGAGSEQPAQGAQTPTTPAAAVRNEVLPAMAGIHGGDMAAMALYELTGGDEVEREAARDTMKLAGEAVEIAQSCVRDLGRMRMLSDALRSEADSAAKTLAEAGASVDRMQGELGRGGATVSREESQAMHKQAAELHEQLRIAGRAIEKIADAHGVPTKLGMPKSTRG
jgi:uncharacterized protein YukE